jgi:hypothetical protein
MLCPLPPMNPPRARLYKGDMGTATKQRTDAEERARVENPFRTYSPFSLAGDRAILFLSMMGQMP